MNRKPTLLLAGLSLLAVTVTDLAAAPIGTLTDEIYNAGDGSSAYDNASSIPVSSTDLIEGLLPISTNYVGNHEAAGGTLSVLTDGTTGVGSNDTTSSSNAAFDLGSYWYAEYELPTLNATLGYTLSSVVVTTGHQDNRVDQDYDILVSADGTNFTSLSDGSSQVLGNSDAGFNYGPSTQYGGAAQSTVSPVGANLGTGIKYVEFVEASDGADVYREVDVFGTAAPEPSTWAMLIAGCLGLFASLRSRRGTEA